MWIWLQKDCVKSRVMVKICSVLAVTDVHLLECDVVPGFVRCYIGGN